MSYVMEISGDDINIRMSQHKLIKKQLVVVVLNTTSAICCMCTD